MACSSEINDATLRRLRSDDTTLQMLNITCMRLSDADVAELTSALIRHPNVLKFLCIGVNNLTDESGVKIAQYVAKSSTIEEVWLNNNQFGDATYLAIAAALQVNASLQRLYLQHNRKVDISSIQSAFTNTLRVNSKRPITSKWKLWKYSCVFSELQAEARKLGHPSLQLILCARLDYFTFQIKKNTEKKRKCQTRQKQQKKQLSA
jgi:Leucine-rich repeat (LRR) protein